MARIVEIHNRVYFWGKVRPKTSRELTKELHHILETSSGNIGVFVDNNGGYCTNGFGVYNTLSSIKDRDVHVIVVGSAQSAALLALLAVPLENRWCHEDSTFMAHRVRMESVSGTHAYLGQHVQQMAYYTHRMCEIIAKKTHLTREEAKAKFFDDDNENAIYAKEAKKLGFVHRIITDYRCFRWVEKPTKRRLRSAAQKDSSDMGDSAYVNSARAKKQ